MSFLIAQVMKCIYADNAATTKLDMAAFEAMKPFLIEDYSNPSQPYFFSIKAKQAIKQAREMIATCINAEPDEIFFTSGGTESDNWAIKCFTSPNDIKHIVTSEIEHQAILSACKNAYLSDVIYLPVNEQGEVTPDDLQKFFDRPREYVCSCEATLVSIMLGNNEIGTIQPVEKLARIAHKHGAIFHTDAVQAVGHIPIDVKKLGVDMLSASAHKFNGPKGIGFLYCQNSMMQSFHNGGSQEMGMRAGTENVPAIVAMAVALKNNCKEMQKNIEHIQSVSTAFLEKLTVDYKLNGSQTNKLAGINSIAIPKMNGESLLHLLDLKGFCVSTGSACDSVNTQISHVLKAIHLPDDLAQGTIRVSFGKDNTKDEAIMLAQTINKIVSMTK